MEGVEQADRVVREPMDLLQREPIAVEPPDQAPAALGAEVQGQKVAGGRHRVSRPPLRIDRQLNLGRPP